MHEMFRQLIDWYLHSLDKGGYWLVALLMAIESSIVPLPSELVIPPAAHLAYTQGKMSVTGVVIAGALGSWIGAAVMYWASRLAGRPLVMRYGRLVLVSPEKVAAAERWAARYGPFGIFFSRLLPVVRHLIGIPAGIVRMDFRLYSLYTLIGSTLWCAVLAWLGIKAGQDEALMRGELHRITLWVAGAFVVIGVMYYLFVHRQMKAEKE
ncbi:MAG: DedA family protein [Opitutaceae bacterium]|nr:DedA family protein [Opitutaceae bacterium]